MILEIVTLALISLPHVSYVPMNWAVSAIQLMDSSLIMQEAAKIVNLLILTLAYNVMLMEYVFVILPMDNMSMLMEYVWTVLMPLECQTHVFNAN